MKIRKEQLEVFESAAVRNFQVYMVEHLKEFTPKYSEVLGETGLRSVIRSGLARAGEFGLTGWSSVRFFIELTLLLGTGFDTDPQLPWAAEILNSETTPDEDVKASQLYEKTISYLDAVGGPDFEYVKMALRRAVQKSLEDSPSLGGPGDNEVVEHLRSIYPQKCDYVGETQLHVLIQSGIEDARKYGLTTERGAVLFVGLMFALGHQFALDPRFPWVAIALKDPEANEPNLRVAKLFDEMMKYLNQSLTELEH